MTGFNENIFYTQVVKLWIFYILSSLIDIRYRGPTSGTSETKTLETLVRLCKGDKQRAEKILNTPGYLLKQLDDSQKAMGIVDRLAQSGVDCSMEAQHEILPDTMEPFGLSSSTTCPHCGSEQEDTRICRDCGKPIYSKKPMPTAKKANAKPKAKVVRTSDNDDDDSDQPLVSPKIRNLLLLTAAILVFYFAGTGWLEDESESELEAGVSNSSDISTLSSTAADQAGMQAGENSLGEAQPGTDPAANPDSLKPGSSDSGSEAIYLPNGSAQAVLASQGKEGMLDISNYQASGKMPEMKLDSLPGAVATSSQQAQISTNTLSGQAVMSQASGTITNTTIEEGKMNPAQSVFSADKVHIPSEQMAVLREIDPLTDSGWEKKTMRVLGELGPDERKYAYSQFLEPKGIKYIPADRRFKYIQGESLQEVAKTIQNAELRNIAQKLLKAVEGMKLLESVEKFADHLEGALEQVNKFDSKEDLKVQKEKNKLRTAFITELINVTRNAKFEVERNPRGLGPAAIKNYIIEVFLKQQLLGYRFRTLPIGTLEQDPNEFIRGVIATEARNRQCDIVKTDSLLYLIAPVKDARQNPYSVRRFLRDESLLEGSFVYFNGVVIKLSDRLNDVPYQKAVTRVVNQIVTLERQLSDSIVALVRGLDDFHHGVLSPMLKQSLSADGGSLNADVDERMDKFEWQFEQQVMSKVQDALVNMATTNDDFEYLFFSLNRLLIELAAELRDFGNQQAAWNHRVEVTELKMLALLHLLDKRKLALFTAVRDEDPDGINNPQQLIKELNRLLGKYSKEIAVLKSELREVLDREEKIDSKFKEWANNITSFMRKKQADPDDLQQKIQTAKRKSFLELIRTLKQYPDIKIYMEYEDVTPVIDGIRHYAIAQGLDGISMLPIILRLQEDSNVFDIGEVKRALIPKTRKGLNDS
ncbi:MAG: hypothetical protein GY744_17290 [Gammaproteobacteria bacterium]|nr:hypothetical protein [Gammaproteobacteria bacterium]